VERAESVAYWLGAVQPTKPNLRWAEGAAGPAGQGQVALLAPGTKLEVC